MDLSEYQFDMTTNRDNIEKALTSIDVATVKKFTAGGKFNMKYDKVLANVFVQYKWSLRNVIELRDPDITRIFLEGNDSINVNDHYNNDIGWTALHKAVHDLDVEHVKLLLDHGADPTMLAFKSLRTPLWYLYAPHDEDNTSNSDDENTSNSDDEKALEIVKMLIDRGARTVIVQSCFKKLQVLNILIYGNAQVVAAVLNMKIDLKERFWFGNTVIHYLAHNERIVNSQIWEMMSNKDFDVNSLNIMDKSPLHLASANGVIDGVEILLSKGAELNLPDTDFGLTPVHIATRACIDSNYEKNYIECVIILLQHGADVQVAPTRHDHKTILDDIRLYGDDTMMKLILEHLALQKALGTSITKLIQTQIDSESKFKEYFDVCKQMLAAEIYRSETLFQLLTCNEEKLVPYMRNEELVRILHSCSDNSIYYNRLLQDRLTKASQAAALRSSAADIISKLIKINNSLITDIIINYLEDQDLNMLLSLTL